MLRRENYELKQEMDENQDIISINNNHRLTPSTINSSVKNGPKINDLMKRGESQSTVNNKNNNKRYGDVLDDKDDFIKKGTKK